MALAEVFAGLGARLMFICQEAQGDLCDELEVLGHKVVRLGIPPKSALVAHPGDRSATVEWWQIDAGASAQAIRSVVDELAWLVVDHYAIDIRWERVLRPLSRNLLVIDDLGNRPHDCDVLLDQNLHRDSERLYAERLPPTALRFFGPQYALLRPEFDEPGLDRPRDGSIRRLLVFFGGIDIDQQTLKVLEAIDRMGTAAPEVTFVLGSGDPIQHALRKAARGLNGVEILEGTNRMARLMFEADLGIGACGIAAWERCVVGLPALVSVNAENQREDAAILHELGANRFLGDAGDVSAGDWMRAIERACDHPEEVAGMARASFRVMEGRQEARKTLKRVFADGLG